MNPVSRKDLIRRLKHLGFDGPFAGGKHSFLIRDSKRLILPNPHQQDISVGLLKRILRQAGVSDEEWSKT